jgi:hypothetical protein
MDKRTYLKVKICSLAAEARIIRKQEQKTRRSDIRVGLSEHRRGIVRTVARNTLVAYGFIRGKDYEQVEYKAKTEPSWSKVRTMVEKYGTARMPGEDWNEYGKRRKLLMKNLEKWIRQAQKTIARTVKAAS